MTTVTSLQKAPWTPCQAIATDVIDHITRVQSWWTEGATGAYSVYNHTLATPSGELNIYNDGTSIGLWNSGTAGLSAVGSIPITALFTGSATPNQAYIEYAGTYPFGISIAFSGATTAARIASFSAALALVIPDTGWSAVVIGSDPWYLLVTAPAGSSYNGDGITIGIITGAATVSSNFNYNGQNPVTYTLQQQLAAMRTVIAAGLNIIASGILIVGNKLHIPGSYNQLSFQGGFTTLGTAIPAKAAIPDPNTQAFEQWLSASECAEIPTTGKVLPYGESCATGATAVAGQTIVYVPVPAPPSITNRYDFTGGNGVLFTIPANTLLTHIAYTGSGTPLISIGTASLTPTDYVDGWDTSGSQTFSRTMYFGSETILYIAGLTGIQTLVIYYQ